METKICTKCHTPKALDEYSRQTRGHGGRTSQCKACLNAKSNKYRSENHDKCVELQRKWRTANPEKAYASELRWKRANPAKRHTYYKQKQSTAQGTLNSRMRGAINRSLEHGKQGHSWEFLVGYTVTQLKRRLEKQFGTEYSWDNRPLWHIDHIIPIAAFHFETPDDIDFKKCWALKNLRPLWKPDNIRKSDNLTTPFQPSLLIAA